MRRYAATFIYHKEIEIEVEVPDTSTFKEVQIAIEDSAPYDGWTRVEWVRLED